MELSKKYEPESIENKWYKAWMDNGFFHSTPDNREPFTVVIPPPNVTGVLHMGHMLNNTIQDVLVRRARLLGKNACWVPGTDHASIATEAKVVNKLREAGIKKSDLSRDEFLQHAWDWTDKHGGIILEQLKKLGASCDWERTSFTLDRNYSESVFDTFIDLYNKGYIYRSMRMVNWDPVALTAVSDEEVQHKEVNSKLFYVRYKVKDTYDDWITIATTRPETILADTGVCVHPDDERYKHLVGKKAIIPIVDREVPIIADAYIDKEFGTGCLKVTPAHDINDYELGKKFGLAVIDIMNPNGTLTNEAGKYAGIDRFKVRKEIAKELEELGYLVKVEDHVNKVGFSERTDAVIEPRLSLQWFVKMKDLSKPALDNVANGNIKFHPAKFINTYKHWMENVKDWCISRQLWWGHRIPAFYFGTGANDYVIARTAEEALELAKTKSGNTGLTLDKLIQDEDVLDTWFSSWLWPISVFDPELIKKGKGKANADLKYYYPTNDLVTAPEIMFFWVARMIISGYEYMGDLPFKNVYFTGIVRDKLGRKMSKQLGNSPDPIDLIEKYGADGVRAGMLFSSPAGNDLLFDSQYCEQGRNFCNKIWNALRLVKGWNVSDIAQPDSSKVACEWFDQRLNVALGEINDHFDKFRISDALITMYKLIWDDFCAWYLEMIKPGFEAPIDKATHDKTLEFFEKLSIIMHPFMPFLSEEIWHELRPRKDKDYCIVAKWPVIGKANTVILDKFALAEEIVTNIRNIRKEKNIANKVPVDLKIAGTVDAAFDSVIVKLCNIKSMERSGEKPKNAFSFIVKSAEFFIPFTEQIDVASEKAALKKELEYTKGFLKSVDAKLSNERFVSGAKPNVLELEKQKQSDALAKIKLIEEKLASLN
ncbi:MAG TPA: valine--tRNA ligase [Flavobacteriales bacterium]|nr:valine--tRNA ligase [Flavobacteriales bacterium]